MNYRNTEILDAKTLTGAGTEVIPLNVQAPISRITLHWKITKVNVGMDSYMHKDITKIELVDGSDVLYSLDGGQSQALCIYDRECPTMNYGQEIAANSQRSNYGIDFGRFLYDPELALDPSKFRNLQLKVTYDSDVSDTGVASGVLEVWADVFDEKVISPVGFLMAKEHFNTGTPDSGYTYVDLPTDHPLRKLLLQGYYKAYEPWYVISSAKLSEDNDKRIPFNVNMARYAVLRMGIDKPIIEFMAGQLTGTSHAIYATPTNYWSTLVLLPEAVGRTLGGGSSGKGGYHLISSTTTGPWQGIIQGYLPNHCFQFPFGRQDQIDDWYDVTRVGSLRLRLEVGTHHDDERQAVILQQLRRY